MAKASLKFGHLEKHPIGKIFEDRLALGKSGIHTPPMHGIWGRKKEGACSIVLSDGYEDDIDELDYVIYTGHGGQKTPGGKQIKDQEFKAGNLALKISFENNLPIRVTRGFQTPNGPKNGYRYDGIYYVNHIERVKGKSGFLMCRFHLISRNSIDDLESLLKNNFKPSYKSTTRSRTVINKIDRDSSLSEKVKDMYNYRCQVCHSTLKKPKGSIAVGAHIKGLGKPHSGPDDSSNIICLCPNHHAQFDAFSFYIDSSSLEIKGLSEFKGKKLLISKNHKINRDFFDYHRKLYDAAQKL